MIRRISSRVTLILAATLLVGVASASGTIIGTYDSGDHVVYTDTTAFLTGPGGGTSVASSQPNARASFRDDATGRIYVTYNLGDIQSYGTVADYLANTNITIETTSTGQDALDRGAFQDVTGTIFAIYSGGDIMSYANVADFIAGPTSGSVAAGLGAQANAESVHRDDGTGEIFVTYEAGDVYSFASTAAFLAGPSGGTLMAGLGTHGALDRGSFFVPEPGTLLLLGAGLVGMGFIGRKRS